MRKTSILLLLIFSVFTLVGCKKEKKEEVTDQLLDIDQTTYENIMKYNDYDLGYYLVLDYSTGEEKWGLYDDAGKEVLAPVYDFLFPPTDGKIVFYIAEEDKCGVIDLDGNTIIPLEYEVLLPGHNGLYAAKFEDYWGFINEDGDVIIDFQFDQVDGMSFVNDYGNVVKDGERFFINREGERVLDLDYYSDIMYGKSVVSNQNNELYNIDTLELIEDGDRLLYYSRGYQYYATRSTVMNSDHEVVLTYPLEMGLGGRVIGDFLTYTDVENGTSHYFNLVNGDFGEITEEYRVAGMLTREQYLYNPTEYKYYFPDGYHCILDDNPYRSIGSDVFFYKNEGTYTIKSCDNEEIYNTELHPLYVGDEKLVLYNTGGMQVIDLKGNLLFESEYQPAIYHVDFTLEYHLDGEYLNYMFNNTFFNGRLLVTDTDKVYVMDENGELIIDEGFDAIFRTDTILYSILHNHPYMINLHQGFSYSRIYENVD